jgi:hypothetical protein
MMQFEIAHITSTFPLSTEYWKYNCNTWNAVFGNFIQKLLPYCEYTLPVRLLPKNDTAALELYTHVHVSANWIVLTDYQYRFMK